MYGRELQKGDKCLRVTLSRNAWKPRIEIVTVLELAKFRIKIGTRRYVDSNNLILLSTEGLV